MPHAFSTTPRTGPRTATATTLPPRTPAGLHLVASEFATAVRGAHFNQSQYGGLGICLEFICRALHIEPMRRRVEIAEEFEPEFFGLPQDVRGTILALSRLLRQFGRQSGRPRVDTLNGSRHTNMKEMRCSAADGEWGFAFDPARIAPSCSLQATSRAAEPDASTARSSARPTNDSTGASPSLRRKESRDGFEC